LADSFSHLCGFNTRRRKSPPCTDCEDYPEFLARWLPVVVASPNASKNLALLESGIVTQEGLHQLAELVGQPDVLGVIDGTSECLRTTIFSCVISRIDQGIPPIP
jgi:hypothetical protein